jgi:S1-C subfamily serine protease
VKKRTRKNVLLKKLLILTLLVLGVGGFPLSTDAAVNLNYHSVVKISMIGKNEGGHGTGVIIGPNQVATAKHVAAAPDTTVVVIDENGKEYKAVSVEVSDKTDFAIITVEKRFDGPKAKISCKEPKPLDKVYIVGFPLDFNRSVYENTVVGYYQDGDYGNVLLATGVSLPGNSGGPVFDAQGRLVGILVAEYLYGDEKTYLDSDVNIIVPAVGTEGLCTANV